MWFFLFFGFAEFGSCAVRVGLRCPAVRRADDAAAQVRGDLGEVQDTLFHVGRCVENWIYFFYSSEF